jgi:hypothetical protein
MVEKTHLCPITNKFVNDEFVKLRREKISVWAFLHSARPFSCDDFFKRPIKYQGVRFEGLPSKVFWNGFIEPFLNDIIFRAIDQTLKLCRIGQIDAQPVVEETCGLLKSMARKIYAEMVEVDLLLCNENNLHGSEKMDVRKHIDAMDRVIDSWAEFELSKLKLRLSSNF